MSETMNTLKKHVWETPESYFGYNPVGEYCVAACTRDSDTITRSNWEIFLGEMNAAAVGTPLYGKYQDGESMLKEYFYVWEASHWACGWIKYLMIKPDAPECILERAAELLDSLSDYPILDDDHHSGMEYDEILDFWESLDLKSRIEYCRDAGDSIFAARRDTMETATFYWIRDSWV